MTSVEHAQRLADNAKKMMDELAEATEGAIVSSISDPVEGEIVEAGSEVAVRGRELDTPEDDEDDDVEPAWDDADKTWEYEFVEYKGDRLAVRKPLQQALTGLSMGASKFMKPEKQLNFITLFVERHMSEASYDRLIDRMMDPGDTEYGPKSFAQVMKLITSLAREKKDDKELEEKPGGAGSGDTPS